MNHAKAEAIAIDLMQLSPMADWILLRPRDGWEDPSGIVLPANYEDDTHGSDNDMIRQRNQLCLADVVGVGLGRRTQKGVRCKPAVETGEQVMYNRADASRVEASDLVLVREHAIFLAIAGDVRQVIGGLVHTSE